MIRSLLILAVVATLQACSSNQPSTSRIARQPDSLCIDDCLGAGGTHEFCQDRCGE